MNYEFVLYDKEQSLITIYFHDYIPIDYKYFNYLLDASIRFFKLLIKLFPQHFLHFKKIPNLLKLDVSDK